MTCFQVIFLLSIAGLCCAGFLNSARPQVEKLKYPVFPANHVVKGVLLLPYAEIKEPFIAYYDEQNNRSRIDYYGGMVKTYQRGDEGRFGTSYKIAYMPDSKGQPRRTCFQVNGGAENSVTIQRIVPDLSGFSYVKDDLCKSWFKNDYETMCEVWVSENTVGTKVNHYTMYVQKGCHVPVYYLMMGKNTLLGSHYDKYEIYYTGFLTGNASEEDFSIEHGMKCRDFPGPGVEGIVSNNPMMEFMNNEDRHIHEAFDKFANKHGKSYKDEKEQEFRKDIFRQNYRYINSINRAGLSYALSVNHLADFSDQERRMLRGRLPSSGYNGGKPFPSHEFLKPLPEFVDWKLFGAVTPVKDQAVCGSCWSFGTTGTIEGAHFLKTKKLVRLSQQQLIDCSWQYQNNGCDGGEDFRAYQYIMSAGGLASEEDYGPYLGADGICHERNVTKTATITGYVNVTAGNATALKLAVAYMGPISISIDASPRSFSFYSYGIYYEPTCKSKEDQLDHSVLLVGYGSVGGQDYWIVKNSWSTYWGNDGYILMSQKGNNCGVATSPTYVLM